MRTQLISCALLLAVSFSGCGGGDSEDAGNGVQSGADAGNGGVDVGPADSGVPPLLAAPRVIGATPVGPANDNAPLIMGDGAPENAAIGLFSDAGCTTSAGMGSADGAGAFAIRIMVADDTTTTLFAAVVGDTGQLRSSCSTDDVTYVEDSSAPGVPADIRTTPRSPANDNFPIITGRGEPDATYQLFLDPGCQTATSSLTDSDALSTAGLRVMVTDNSTTTYYLRGTDGAGNASGCLEALTYVEDSVAPSPPTVVDIDPGPTGASRTPRVRGQAEAGSTVSLYRDPACLLSVSADGPAAVFETAGLPATVQVDSINVFFARTIDAAGNASPCSTTSARYEQNDPPQFINLPGMVECFEDAAIAFTATATDTPADGASLRFSEMAGGSCNFARTVAPNGQITGTCGIVQNCSVLVLVTDGLDTTTGTLIVNILPRPGTLDRTFGAGDGFVTFGGAAGSPNGDVANALFIDPAGRILVTGWASNDGPPATQDMALWRVMPNGRLDPALDGDGVITHDGAAGASGHDIGWSVRTDAAGNLLVGGESCVGPPPCFGNIDAAFWRFLPTGAPDATFDQDGVFTADPSGDDDIISALQTVMIAGQERIVGLGTGLFGQVIDPNLIVYRLDGNGALDPSFDQDGLLVFDEVGAETVFAMEVVADAGEQKIIAAGTAEALNQDREMLVWRFNQDGAKDNTFGSTCTIAGGPIDNVICFQGVDLRDDVAQAIARDGTGRILLAGFTLDANGQSDIIVWRTSAAGIPDTTFGENGEWWRTFDGGDADAAEGVAVDAQGRVVVVGFTVNQASGNEDMIVLRFNPDGTPDMTFGPGGSLIHDGAAGGESADRGNAVTFDAAGRIVITGFSSNLDQAFEMAVWRVNP